MFWFVVFYHIILALILVNGNFSKLLFLTLTAALFLPSIIKIVANISVVFDMYNDLKTTGLSLIKLSLFGLYAIPFFVLLSGLVLFVFETFTALPVPCINKRWLKIPGLRLLNAGCGINAGVWLASYFLNGR